MNEDTKVAAWKAEAGFINGQAIPDMMQPDVLEEQQQFEFVGNDEEELCFD